MPPGGISPVGSKTSGIHPHHRSRRRKEKLVVDYSSIDDLYLCCPSVHSPNWQFNYKKMEKKNKRKLLLVDCFALEQKKKRCITFPWMCIINTPTIRLSKLCFFFFPSCTIFWQIIINHPILPSLVAFFLIMQTMENSFVSKIHHPISKWWHGPNGLALFTLQSYQLIWGKYSS